MQIDIYKFPVKEFLKWLGWVLFFSSIWFRGCSTPTESEKTTKVIVPAVSGKFEPKKPEQTPLKWPKNDQTKTVIKWNEKLVPVKNPINIDLANQYVMAKDSIERLNLYIKSIELNSFSSSFEDKYMSLTINGIVRGEVQEITPSYTLKEREADAIIEQTYLRILGGGSIGFNRDLNQFIYKLDVDFQNRKGDVISGEYLRVNNQDYGMIGFKKSLLNFKR